MWYPLQRFLCKVGILNEFDYASPDSQNERPHAYERRQTFRPSRDNKRENDIPVGECCARCAGGKRHQIHHPPFQMDDCRTTDIAFEGGPHVFEGREDGYCKVCGGGRFYGLHTRPLGESAHSEAMGPGEKLFRKLAGPELDEYLPKAERELTPEQRDRWFREYHRHCSARWTDGCGNFSPHKTLTCDHLMTPDDGSAVF